MTLRDGLLLGLAYCSACVSALYLLDSLNGVDGVSVAQQSGINREVCCGFEEIIADFLWFKAMYACDTPEALVCAIDTLTTLDPHYLIAYRLGALSLITEYKRYDLALLILAKSRSSPLYGHDNRLALYTCAVERILSEDTHKAYTGVSTY
jgi:hypothetical protein